MKMSHSFFSGTTARPVLWPDNCSLLWAGEEGHSGKAASSSGDLKWTECEIPLWANKLWEQKTGASCVLWCEPVHHFIHSKDTISTHHQKLSRRRKESDRTSSGWTSSNHPVWRADGESFQYILSCVRYFQQISLPLFTLVIRTQRPLVRSSKIYCRCGPPQIVQCSHFAEFQIKIIHGRPYHPQSQGKV